MPGFGGNMLGAFRGGGNMGINSRAGGMGQPELQAPAPGGGMAVPLKSQGANPGMLSSMLPQIGASNPLAPKPGVDPGVAGNPFWQKVLSATQGAKRNAMPPMGGGMRAIKPGPGRMARRMR